MGRALDPKKIKSAQRVLEVLEYFTHDREEATVMDIARAMGYPQSSTSELLSCLVALGYLHRDRQARTYRPSARVALIGSWVQPHFFRRGALPNMMDRLAEEAGATVVLATRIGLEIQYIHTVSPTGETHESWSPGAKGLLLHSTVGKALLSCSDADYVRKIVHRLNAESSPELRVSADNLIADLKGVRGQGYALGVHETGGGMLAVLLPQSNHGEQLALGICGNASMITARTDELVRLLRAAVSRQFGPVAVSRVPGRPITEPMLRAVG
jgi:DNA-binding IclR family transcriptional regulator